MKNKGIFQRKSKEWTPFEPKVLLNFFFCVERNISPSEKGTEYVRFATV